MKLRRLTTGATTLALAVGLLTATGVPAVAAPTADVDTVTTRAQPTGDVLLAWKRVPGATGYQVQIADSPSFDSANLVEQVTTSALRWVPTSPMWGTDDQRTLYWRVVPQGVGALASEATVSTFERAPAPAPEFVGPDDAAIVTYPEPVVLRWRTVPGASRYTVTYGLAGAASPTVVGDLKSTSFAPQSLGAGSYEWSVQAHIARADATTSGVVRTDYPGTRSETRTFQVVGLAATTPTLLAPADKAVANDVEFRWTAVDGASRYLVELSKDRDFAASSVVLRSEVSGTAFVPTAVLPSTTYFWRVTPYDVSGVAGEPSGIWQVSKRMAMEDGSELSSDIGTAKPAFLNISTDVTDPTVLDYDSFELSWTPVPRATFYEVQVNLSGRDLVTCRTASTSATIVASSASVGNETTSLSDSAACLWSSKPEARIRPVAVDPDRPNDSVFIATVIAVNMSAADTSKFPGTDPSDGEVVATSESAHHYFRVVDGGRAQSATMQADPLPAVTTEVSPTLSWAPFAGADGYIVQMFADASKSTRIAELHTITPRLRSTGVFRLNNTTSTEDAYVAEVWPASVVGDTWSVLVGKPPADLRWKRDAPTPAQGAATDESGVPLLRMTPTPRTALGGASRGYVVRIFKAGSSAVYAELKVDQPSTVAAKAFTTTGTTFKATGLETGSYQYDWAVLDPSGNAGPFAWPKTSFEVGAGHPTNLRQTVEPDGTSALLRWDSPVSASSYSVFWKASTATTWSSASTTARALSINTLSPGKTYSWKVRSKDKDGNLTVESPTTTFTVPQASAGVVLTSPQIVLASSSSATIRWSAVPGASRYLVRVAPAATGLATATPVETTALSFVPTAQLGYGTTYTYDVRAVPEVIDRSGSRPVLATSATGTLTVTTVPGKPGTVTTSRSGAGISASWPALTGSAVGSSAAPSYVVRFRVKATPERSWSELAPTAATAMTLSGLARNTTYEVQVAAQNAEGRGPWSAVSERLTATVPATPGVLKVTSKLNAVDASWSRPADGGSPLTAVVLRYRPTTSSTWSVVTLPATATRYTVTGLASATRYRLEVFGRNAVGSGAVSAAEQISLGRASAPRAVTVTRGDRTAQVAWTAPASTGGAPLTAYAVQARSYRTSSKTWSSWATKLTTSSRSVTLSSLTNGTRYQVRVVARTSVGDGTASSAVAVVPAGKPTAATSVKATSPKTRAIKVTWGAAGANGSPIKGYKVQVASYGSTTYKTVATVGASARSYTWTKATSKKKYTVRVVAVNAVGSTISARVSVTSR